MSNIKKLLEKLKIHSDKDAEITEIDKQIKELESKKQLLMEKQIERLKQHFNLKEGDVVEYKEGNFTDTYVIYGFSLKSSTSLLNMIDEFTSHNKIDTESLRKRLLNISYYKLTKNNKVDKRVDPRYNKISVEDFTKIGEYDFKTDTLILINREKENV